MTEKNMTLDRIIFTLAGFMILLSLLLTHFHSPHWVWFTAFIGANLFQSGFTRFCPAAIILKKLGIKSDAAF
ncbi:MAG: hypothetical protein NEHIOOID_00359 [Holosporales bacterium]